MFPQQKLEVCRETQVVHAELGETEPWGAGVPGSEASRPWFLPQGDEWPFFWFPGIKALGGALDTLPPQHKRREREGEVLTARARPRVQVIQLIVREGVIIPGALKIHRPLEVLTAPALSLRREETGTGLST